MLPNKLNIKKVSFQMLSIETIVLFTVYLISYVLSLNHNFVSAITLVISAVIYYLYFSFTGERSFLKFKSVFSGVWLFTIGISQFRLLGYQVAWVPMTWINVCFAHIFFLLANDLAHQCLPIFESSRVREKIQKINFLNTNVSQNRLFVVAMITSLVSMLCLIIGITIKGFVPLFAPAEIADPYLKYYTKFHIFVVAGLVSGGLSYLCLRRYTYTPIKKILLWINIFVLVFVIPILIVSRGTFVSIALILLASIYLSSKRKFWLLAVGIIVILGIYQLGSSLRNYSDEKLDNVFQPKQIIISDGNGNDSSKDNKSLSLKLSPKVSFLYSYLTSSHDNFNCAVVNKKVNTWGVRQLKPFLELINIDSLQKRITSAEIYLIKPYLTTSNLISSAYYDFGIFGVIVLTFIWSFCFGLVEAFSMKYNGIFSYLAYGVCLSPITLSFFNPWLSNFTTWLLWGTVFLIYLAASITFKRRDVS